MHAVATTVTFSASDLIGYTAGLLITAVLLALTLRAARLPGTPLANIAFALSAFLWTLGGLAQAVLLASGLPRADRLVLAARAVQYCGAAAFPIPILAIWGRLAPPRFQRAARVVRIVAGICAVAIGIALWLGVITGQAVMNEAWAQHVTGVHATSFLIIGAAFCLRRTSAPRPVYATSLVIFCAACGALVSSVITAHLGRHAPLAFWLGAIGAHLMLVVALCAFLLFARFRYADVFIRYAVRIVLGAVWAAVLILTSQSIFAAHVGHPPASMASLHVFLMILFANSVLLSFTFVDERLSGFVNRWLFRPADYRAETRKLAETLKRLETEAQIAAAAEDAVSRPLGLRAARWIAISEVPELPILMEGEVAALDRTNHSLSNAELAVPIASAGKLTHALLISPGFDRPGLVTNDLNYLLSIANQCGYRLDALRHEREAVERQSREAVLRQQVTQAELRALRAQINPHFLFNSLNTIADLIVRDPARAETMTLRLASAFRYVLAHSQRAVTPVREEIEFLRTYLYIEEVRFGDRLRTEINVQPEVAAQEVPSLILQTLVENALKHGLAPKPGPGRLWISAFAEGADLCLRVEDDGLGLPAESKPSQGLGLVNITERLTALYGGHASLVLEPRAGGGARATIRVPRAIEGPRE